MPVAFAHGPLFVPKAMPIFGSSANQGQTIGRIQYPPAFGRRNGSLDLKAVSD
jgi:hypothetical protein